MITWSSTLQIWYVEVRIYRSISESSLDFEITTIICTAFGWSTVILLRHLNLVLRKSTSPLIMIQFQWHIHVAVGSRCSLAYQWINTENPIQFSTPLKRVVKSQMSNSWPTRGNKTREDEKQTITWYNSTVSISDIQRQHLFPKTLPLKWICCCKAYLMSRWICKKVLFYSYFFIKHMLWISVRIASVRRF